MAGFALTKTEYLPQADTVSPSAESGWEYNKNTYYQQWRSVHERAIIITVAVLSLLLMEK